MTQEVRQWIFEPFYTTKGINGTGLELWISSGIVTTHRGSFSYIMR
jgi:signal transduction histidine kinase